MDDSGANTNLDKALLPGADNPLLPSQFIPNAGLNIPKLVDIRSAALTYSFNAQVGAITANESANVQIPNVLRIVPICLIYCYDPTGSSNFLISNGTLYNVATLGYNSFAYIN